MDALVPRPKRARAQRETAPTTPDPIEMAMEAEAGDNAADSPARTLLINQNRLIRRQILNENAGFALKMIIVLAALVAAAALAAMAWQAAHDTSVVVKAFRAPPAYAGRGLSGEALAERFVDRLTDIRRQASVSLLASSNVRESGDDIRIEIPQTGVSLGEIQRLLQTWLGHQTVISGSLVEDKPGLVTLTARLEGRGAVTVSGRVDDLDDLLQTLAERAFNLADPVNSVIYLTNSGRPDEALAAARQSARNYELSSKDVPKASVVGVWAVVEGDPARQVEVAQRALALDDKMMTAHRALGVGYRNLGREQDAWDAYGRALTLKAGDQPQGYRAQGVPRMRGEYRYYRALLGGDFAEAKKFETFAPTNIFIQVRALAGAHRPTAATRRLHQLIDELGTSPAGRLFLEAYIADAAGDWNGVIEALRAYDQAREAAISLPGRAPGEAPAPSAVRVAQRDAQRLRRDAPLLARALAWSGDVEGARSLLAPTPLDCAPCLRARGEVEWAARNWSGAEAWLAKADAATPSLPQAQLLMAQTRLAHGDLDGALRASGEAHRRSPRFADPLETWGEVLLAKGDARAAIGKFAKAAEFAPRWGRLHLKWGEALAKLGKAEEAQAQWRTAAKLDLTADERAELARVQGAK